MNPLYSKFGNPPVNNGPFANLSNAISQFQQFRSQFQGDPRERVQQLLNSGQMTQDQFNQLSAMAKQFQGLLGGTRMS